MFYKSGGYRYKWKSACQHIILLVAYVNAPDSFFVADLSVKDGLPSYFHLLISHILFGLPFLYLELFIGKYSRTGCLCFGRMMPITIGLGYTMLINTLHQLIAYGSLITTVIHYLVFSLSTELPWKTCNSDWPLTCMDIERSGVNNCTKTTQLSSELYFSYHFTVHEIPNMKIDSIGQFEVFQSVCLMAVWFITFLSCLRSQDFNFSMRWSVGAQLISNLVLAILIFIARGDPSFFIKFDERQVKSLLDLDAWVEAVWIISRSIGLHYGVHILFGSYMKLEQSVDNTAIIIDFIIIFLTLQYGWLISTCYEIIREKTNCTLITMPLWKSNNKRLLFVVVPFALGYLGIPQFWSFIYFCCLLFACINCLITRICFMYCCLADEYSQAQFYRSYILGFLCLFCFVADIPSISNQGFTILERIFFQTDFTKVFVIIFIMSLTVCYFYGAERFCTDIHFMTGNRPPLYWKVCWYLSLGIIVIEILFLRKSTIEKKVTNSYENILEKNRYIVKLLILFPVIGGVGFEIFRKLKKHNLTALFIPSEYWGPPIREERKNRRLFHPKTETRDTRLVDSCDHNCLHSSAVLQRIVELEAKMRRQHFDERNPRLQRKMDQYDKSISFANI